MYKNTKWLDKVVDADSGEVIQEGTDQSAANFNNMEEGISDAHLALGMFQAMLPKEFELCRIAVLEGELAPGKEIGSPLPVGFKHDNCCIVSAMFSKNGGKLFAVPPIVELEGLETVLTMPNDVSVMLGGENFDDVVNIHNNTETDTILYRVALQRYK